MQAQSTPGENRCKIYGCFLEKVAAQKDNHRTRGYCNLHHRVLYKANGDPDRQFNIVAPDRQPDWISVNTRGESKRFAQDHLCTWNKKYRSWGREYDARMYTDNGLPIPPSDIDMSDDQLLDFDFSPTRSTIDAETACQVLQAASAETSIEQPLPAPPSTAAPPTIVAPLATMLDPGNCLASVPPPIQRSQGANGTLLLTQGESLPQTQQDLPDGTSGYEDKTAENHRAQVQLLIHTLVSEGPSNSPMTAAQILDLDFGAALMFKDRSIARTERITERFSRYFYSLARAPAAASVDRRGRKLVSNKIGLSEYSFSVALAAGL